VQKLVDTMETYFLVDIDDYVVSTSGHDCERKRCCSRRDILREVKKAPVCMKVLLVCATLIA
jgi:hypothetical protein